MDNQHSSTKKTDQAYYWLAVQAAGDFGASIAIPALIAAYAGQQLDAKWGTEPRMLILLLIIALVLTAVIIVKKTKQYAIRFKELNNESD